MHVKHTWNIYMKQYQRTQSMKSTKCSVNVDAKNVKK